MNQNTIVPNIGQWKIKEEFNVLSEFDGMSCGQLALQMAGKKVTNYFASEIDKYAIQIANKNFPNTKQLGDVTKINISKLPKIHLFIGGSPCQGFSFAGKQLNFSDPRSKLFFEFAADLRFIQEFVNPEVKFFLENVKMKKEFQDVISRFLGVEPIEINSALVSAQNRKRLYWTNIKNVTIPEDKGILLKDILESGIVDRDKSYCIDANYFKGGNLKQYFEKSRRQLVFEYKNSKNVLINEKDIYKPVSFMETRTEFGKEQRRLYKKETGLDFSPRSKEGKQYEIRKNNKANCLVTVDSFHNYIIDKNYYIRKLTPIECERLQTVPDNYTAGVSDAQRHKMLGNGCTVDVIAHIFSFLS